MKNPDAKDVRAAVAACKKAGAPLLKIDPAEKAFIKAVQDLVDLVGYDSASRLLGISINSLNRIKLGMIPKKNTLVRMVKSL